MTQHGRYEEGLGRLQQLTLLCPADFRPWWAIAHLSTEVQQRREALHRVLALKPDQSQARELLMRLDSEAVARAS